MKIIGQTNEGYILSATIREIANLLGYYGSFSTGFKKPEDGDIINIADMYNHLFKLKEEQKKLSEMANSLRTAATLIDALPEPLTTVEVGPDKEVDENLEVKEV